MKKIFAIMMILACMMACKETVKPLGETTNFREATETALNSVMPEYPTAILLEVSSVLVRDTTGALVNDAIYTDRTQAVFRLEDEEHKGNTLYVSFEDGLPVVTIDDAAWLGSIQIPHRIDMHVAGAIDRLAEEGIDVTGNGVVLRHPTNLGVFEPQYIFGNDAIGVTAVGVFSGKIY